MFQQNVIKSNQNAWSKWPRNQEDKSCQHLLKIFLENQSYQWLVQLHRSPVSWVRSKPREKTLDTIVLGKDHFRSARKKMQFFNIASHKYGASLSMLVFFLSLLFH